jgi:SAM-dependent methyltransferase
MSDFSQRDQPLYGERGGQHFLARFVDHQETYGPLVVTRFLKLLGGLRNVVDLGAGSGRDLAIAKQVHPESRTIAVEGGRAYADALQDKVDQTLVLDIERDSLPFQDSSIDLIMANQVLEHTKEVFWIFHEVTRCLAVGGHFMFGVPNIASLHNRFLLLFGVQPTQHKLCSAHVRPFSKADTLQFLEACFPGGYSVRAFAGSQFYPFPATAARLFARLLPTLAFSIFFLIRKEIDYSKEFVTYPARANLETNFWTGNITAGSQYDSHE